MKSVSGDKNTKELYIIANNVPVPLCVVRVVSRYSTLAGRFVLM
jgi:hypothetical protein